METGFTFLHNWNVRKVEPRKETNPATFLEIALFKKKKIKTNQNINWHSDE